MTTGSDRNIGMDSGMGAEIGVTMELTLNWSTGHDTSLNLGGGNSTGKLIGKGTVISTRLE